MVVTVRATMATTLAGSLFVQVVMVPLMAVDVEQADSDIAHLQIPFAVIVILAIV